MCKSYHLLVLAVFVGTVNCLIKENEDLKDKLFEDKKVIETDKGAVLGHKSKNGDYFAYLGIPYAEPPTGYYRFKAPIPAVPWSGVYEANRTVKCAQMADGDENCLILNVFTPTKTKNEKLPVIVYIHGGSFIIGSSSTKGVEPLIKQDIIMVTINYRLGVFGFLCLGIDAAPGNAGLKDQVLALQWVQKNIGNFGGDAQRVTLYGMSAGAASVELLILSDKTKGLYQSAIIESGSALNVWAINMNPISTVNKLADSLYYSGYRDVNELVKFLRTVSAELLSMVNYDNYNDLTDGTFGFVPCIEKKTQAEALVTEHPFVTMTEQNYKKVPMIVIFSALEGLFLKSEDFYTQDYDRRMQDSFDDFLPGSLVFNSNTSKHDVALNIKHFYFGKEPVSRNTLLEYLNYFGDSLILRRLLDSAKLHSTEPYATKNSVYLMEFAYSGKLGGFDDFYEHIKVAGHGDARKHVILLRPIDNEDDQIAVETLSTLIANFVKFKNPTPFATKKLPSIWPEVTRSNLPYLRLDKNITILNNPYPERMAFWQKIFEDYEKRDISLSAKKN